MDDSSRHIMFPIVGPSDIICITVPMRSSGDMGISNRASKKNAKAGTKTTFTIPSYHLFENTKDTIE